MDLLNPNVKTLSYLSGFWMLIKRIVTDKAVLIMTDNQLWASFPPPSLSLCFFTTAFCFGQEFAENTQIAEHVA